MTRMNIATLVALSLAVGLVASTGCKESDSLPACVSDQKKVTEGISDTDALATCLGIGLDFTQFEDTETPDSEAQAACEKYANDHGSFDAAVVTDACVIVLTPPPDAPPEPDAAPEDAATEDATPTDGGTPDGA